MYVIVYDAYLNYILEGVSDASMYETHTFSCCTGYVNCTIILSSVQCSVPKIFPPFFHIP